MPFHPSGWWWQLFTSAPSVGLFMIFYLSLVRRIKAHNLWGKKSHTGCCESGRKRFYEARKESTRLIVAGIGLMLLHFIFLTSLGFFGILLCLVVDVSGAAVYAAGSCRKAERYRRYAAAGKRLIWIIKWRWLS